MKPWMPVVLALAVGLAACGDGDEESAASEASSASPAGSTEGAPTDGETASASAAEPEGEPPSAAADEAGRETDAEVSVDEAALDDAPATDTLGEEAALPGESTSAEVDEIIRETERRFEEASKKIDEQFEQAERESPESAPGAEATTELETTLDEDVATPASEPALQGSSDPEVEAILEETERRFQEASKKIDEQFEQAEQEVPSEIRDATDVQDPAAEDDDGEAEEAP